MSESKHTPGPWYFSKDPEAKDVIYALNGFEWEEICKMIGRNYKANVALIADAWQLPDLRRENAELKAINKELEYRLSEMAIEVVALTEENRLLKLRVEEEAE